MNVKLGDWHPFGRSSVERNLQKCWRPKFLRSICCRPRLIWKSWDPGRRWKVLIGKKKGSKKSAVAEATKLRKSNGTARSQLPPSKIGNKQRPHIAGSALAEEVADWCGDIEWLKKEALRSRMWTWWRILSAGGFFSPPTPWRRYCDSFRTQNNGEGLQNYFTLGAIAARDRIHLRWSKKYRHLCL